MGHGGVIGGGVGQGFPAGAGVQGGVLGGPGGSAYGSRRISGGAPGGGYQGNNPRRSSGGQGEFQPSPRRSSSGGAGAGAGASAVESDPNFREQKISIPSDMVGCIIGRAGTKINEIRRLSGSKISIAKTAHDETGERMFVISGLPESNEKALFLLYNQLESEKQRRVESVAEEQQDDA